VTVRLESDARSAQKRAVAEYFDDESEEYDRTRDQQYSFILQKKLVLELLDADSIMVLEVGCGTGEMIAELVQRGHRVWGIDISERMIDFAAKKLKKYDGRVHLSLGDVEKLDFPDEYFNAIIAMGVLEYVLTYDAALKEIYRTLKKDGEAIITIPNKVCPYQIAFRFALTVYRLMRRCVRMRKQAAKQDLSVKRCRPRHLDKIIAETGFEKVDSAFCNFVFFPLDVLFPKLSLSLNKKLAMLSKSRCLGWLGTQYVIKIVKE